MDLFDERGNRLSLAEVLAALPKVALPTITRVEVIDETGRSYVNYHPDNQTYLMVQDEGRTLKVVVRTPQPYKP